MEETVVPVLRMKLKQLLPAGAVRVLAGGINYLRRARAWLHVMRVARGRTAGDSAVLRRSFLRAPSEMLRDLRCWREPQLVADAEVHVAACGTFSIRGGSDDLGHVLPTTHAQIFQAMRPFLRPGTVAIDAGANIGAVSVFLARQVGPEGRVIAVEMMPDTASRLRRNLVLNDLVCVQVVEKALSDQAGLSVTAEIPEGLFGQASIAPSGSAGRRVRRVEVPTTTLDDLTRGEPEIAVIKMDLEGAEPLALAGARDTLARTCAVVFESWEGDGGRTAALLAEAGFRISAIDGRNFLATRHPPQGAAK